MKVQPAPVNQGTVVSVRGSVVDARFPDRLPDFQNIATAYDTLMRRLGYDSYGIHGSDGGALVSRELAVLNPEGFLGAHVLQLFSFPTGAPGEMDGFGEKEYAALGHLQAHALKHQDHMVVNHLNAIDI